MTDSSDDEALDLFQEPEGFYQPEKEPTFVKHRLQGGRKLTLRLVGHNPLWGHHLWQAGRVLADYLESHSVDLLQQKTVLELGAGAGLPSLICALRGASHVVVTDYPDQDLVQNLDYNIEQARSLQADVNIRAEGYLWGAPTESLLATLPDAEGNAAPRFDLLILADLLFNHSEHAKLLASVESTLTRTSTAKALVFFTPYRPWLYERDLAFFDLARESGNWEVEKTFETVMEKVMFEEDRGDELLRRTVFGYELKWSSKALTNMQT